jgi:glutamate dehydrogenase (NAD(P)+)
VIQGFGSVGKHAARFLAEKRGGACRRQRYARHDRRREWVGLARADRAQGRRPSTPDYPCGRKLAPDAVIDIPCEIWIPAERHAGNAARLQTQLVAEGANIPSTPEAEQALAARGILVLPDFIANAGGAICAAVEYRGGTETAALTLIDEKIRANTEAMLDEVRRTDALPRTAALSLATERVQRAMGTRRWDGTVA